MRNRRRKSSCVDNGVCTVAIVFAVTILLLTVARQLGQKIKSTAEKEVKPNGASNLLRQEETSRFEGDDVIPKYHPRANVKGKKKQEKEEEKVDLDDIVKEVIAEAEHGERAVRGEREEWALKTGVHRKERIHDV